MRRLMDWVVPVALAALLLLMLAYPSATMDGALDGLRLWARYVLPSLLPYCILSQMLIESGTVARVGRLFAPITRGIFRLPSAGGPSLLLAYLAGSPTGARVARQLYEEGLLGHDAATRFASVSAMAGPLFLVGTVGGMLGESRAGLLVLCACLVAALLNGVLWRFFGKAPPAKEPAPQPLKPALRALPGAIRDACAACIAVGGAIAFFSVLIALATEANVLSVLAAPLSPLLGQDLAKALLSGMLEMTNGIRQVVDLPLSVQQRAALTVAIASFGGLSVAAQAALFLHNIIPMRLYLLQRSTQALLGYGCAIALTPLFFPGVETTTGGSAFCLPCVLVFLLALCVACFVLYAMYPRHKPPYRPGRPPCSHCRPHAGCAGCPMLDQHLPPYHGGGWMYR
jgi:sporulation integral membrane protein YlbJ